MSTPSDLLYAQSNRFHDRRRFPNLSTVNLLDADGSSAGSTDIWGSDIRYIWPSEG